MKKLLVFMLVLGMASLANATLQLSVNGDTDPADSEYWLAPSDSLILDVWTDADITPGVGEGAYAVVAWTIDAVISGGINVSAEPSAFVYAYDDYAGHTGIWVSLALGTAPILPLGSVITDLIDLHLEWSVNDVLVELLFDPVYPIYGVSPVVDSVVIHPEPTTVLLLGLGGLFLRRRR